MSPETLEHFRLEAAKKTKYGQAKIVIWDDIKNDPPAKMKVLPIAAIPHKSKAFRSIFDLSFSLRLSDGWVSQSVNNNKTTLKRAIRQLGHSLQLIIHAFTEVDDNAIFIWQSGM